MILLDQVSKTYRGDLHPALDHVSLHIEPNEFVFLVGQSGAGKSTLMKMITKEEIPDSGKIIIGGIDLDYVKKRYIPHYRRRLGVVYQDFKLLPSRTVYENVAFAMRAVGTPAKKIKKRVPAILSTVNLSDKFDCFPSELSGGEKQRVALARALANNPKIIIADEPTGNIDPQMSMEIMNLLMKINKLGKTVIVVTHEQNIVDHFQKRVITISDGKIQDDHVGGMFE